MFMSDYLIDEKTLTSFADSARGFYGTTDKLTGQEIVDDLANVADEVSTQSELIGKIAGKFVDIYEIAYLEGTLEKFVSRDVTEVGMYAFAYCTSLTTVDLSKCISVYAFAFHECKALTMLIIRTNSVCTLERDNAFTNTPIAKRTGYIYVPKALIDQYKVAENWSRYASQFRAIEDYPDVCGEVSV
jgi:hypothetical protein